MRTTGLILAAGKSLRMAPFQKLELNLRNRSILEWTLFSLVPFCDRVVIVLTPETAQKFGHLRSDPKVTFVLNPLIQSEMLDSLRLGLSEVSGDRVLITPGDCPFAETEAIQALATSSEKIAVVTHQGQTGHPVLLSPQAVRDLLEDTEIRSLRDFLASRPFVRIEVEGSGILRDIDTPSDYQKALASIQGEEGTV